MSEAASPLDNQLLILAPTGRDAQLTCALVATAGHAGRICASVGELCDRAEREGAAALLIAEEVLVPSAFSRMVGMLVAQPAWSDLPIILFTGQGATVQARHPTSQLLAPLGNVLPARPAPSTHHHA